MKGMLSIDGGGIRGLFAATVCEKIEDWYDVPMHELFDLIAGASTGGIIALSLCVPPKGRPASEIVKFYKK